MRRLVFVRHGEYDSETGLLTPLGRRQAQVTARALEGVRFAAIHSSTLPRAKETAAIIRTALRLKPKVRATELLCEAIPTRLPGRTTPERLRRIRENFRRMKRAFDRLVRPARGERIELVVAHGNLIRLFVCLALRLKPEIWLRMHTTNCGITIIVVKDRKGGQLMCFNDVGHLPHEMRTI